MPNGRHLFMALVVLLIVAWQVNRRVLNPWNDNGMTLLMVAADRGHAVAGADPNIKDEEGKSALVHGARYAEILAALREEGAR